MTKAPHPSAVADKVMLRLPPGMRDRLAVAAKENGRSMNSEIVSRLEKSLDQFKTIEELVEKVKNLDEVWTAIWELEKELDRQLKYIKEVDDKIRSYR